MTGLLDPPVAALRELLDRWHADGRTRPVALPGPDHPLPRGDGSPLLLRADTAAELGSPAVGSLAVLLWSDNDAGLPAGVSRLGPDLADLPDGASVPLARVIHVRGRFDDDYHAYLALHDAAAAAGVPGVAVRSRPSTGELWLRVSRRAVAAGLSLSQLGAALVGEVENVDGVRAASVLWVCDDASALDQLHPLARDAARLTGALIKRRTEDVMDCGSCEYGDICEEATTR